MSTIRRIESTSHWRWLLLGSLVLNLLFVGAAGAVAIRYSDTAPLATVTRIDHSLIGRVDRIAAKLPPADAAVLRTQLRTNALKVAAAQADLRLAQEEVRSSLRAQPFDADAMRAAMTKSRAAHDNVDLVIHDLIAATAPKMSALGRLKLADWRIERSAAMVAQ